MALESNLEVFNEAVGIANAADDEELYIEVMQDFLGEDRQNMQQLEAYLEAGDLVNYEILVHALKNNLRTLGAAAAGDAAFDMEVHSKSGELDYVKAHHAEFLDAAALAKKYMRQYLRGKIS